MSLRIVFALLAVLGALSPMQSQAEPIPTTPEQLILNWDMTSELPGPPYDLLQIDLTVSGPVGLNIFATIYTELDGAGAVWGSSGGSGSVLSLQLFNVPQNASVLDGVFSIGVSAEASPLSIPELDSATALGTLGTINTPVVHGVISTASVPEPATLVLLGLGATGLAVLRRRTA